MTFRTLKYGAAIAGLAGALSVAGATASFAGPHWGGHGWGPGAAIGAGAAGFALGAAAASNAQYYGYGPYSGYDGYYDYAPAPVVVDPGPGYGYGYGYGYENQWRRQRTCGRGDISGC